ncbi:MAG: TetR/AcrR family transcriptional regulator [Acidimicrobiales bacterium]
MSPGPREGSAAKKATNNGGGRRQSAKAEAGATGTRRGKGDQNTRQIMIQAAISCILEQGFYRASSNAIADRAGVTWGVIQYYFGSRESLMLAVLEEGTRRLVEDLSTAEITSETLTERIEEYITVVERYYADPEYLAFIQVLINLSHDPRTSAQARETMTKIVGTVEVEFTRLAGQLFGGTAVRHRELRGLLFHVLRGMALSEVMLHTLPFETAAQTKDFPAQRKLLAQALALLIEEQAAPAVRPAKPGGTRKARTA